MNKYPHTDLIKCCESHSEHSVVDCVATWLITEPHFLGDALITTCPKNVIPWYRKERHHKYNDLTDEELWDHFVVTNWASRKHEG
jgi:hypothetical protein